MCVWMFVCLYVLVCVFVSVYAHVCERVMSGSAHLLLFFKIDLNVLFFSFFLWTERFDPQSLSSARVKGFDMESKFSFFFFLSFWDLHISSFFSFEFFGCCFFFFFASRNQERTVKLTFRLEKKNKIVYWVMS